MNPINNPTLLPINEYQRPFKEDWEEVIKFQPRGVLTVPKKMRLFLGIEEKGIARLRISNRQLIIEPVRAIPYPVRHYTHRELKKFFALDKKETKSLKNKKIGSL